MINGFINRYYVFLVIDQQLAGLVKFRHLSRRRKRAAWRTFWVGFGILTRLFRRQQKVQNHHSRLDRIYIISIIIYDNIYHKNIIDLSKKWTFVIYKKMFTLKPHTRQILFYTTLFFPPKDGQVSTVFHTIIITINNK